MPQSCRKGSAGWVVSDLRGASGAGGPFPRWLFTRKFCSWSPWPACLSLPPSPPSPSPRLGLLTAWQPQGSRTSYMTAKVPRIPRGTARSCRASYDLTLENPGITSTTCYGQASHKGQPIFKRMGIRLPSLNGKNHNECVANFNPPQRAGNKAEWFT